MGWSLAATAVVTVAALTSFAFSPVAYAESMESTPMDSMESMDYMGSMEASSLQIRFDIQSVESRV